MRVGKQFDKKTALELELKEIYRQEELIKLQKQKDDAIANQYDYGISEYSRGQEVRLEVQPEKKSTNFTLLISLINMILLIAMIIMQLSTLYWIKVLGV